MIVYEKKILSPYTIIQLYSEISILPPYMGAGCGMY
jgi:hypothetical protein